MTDTNNTNVDSENDVSGTNDKLETEGNTGETDTSKTDKNQDEKKLTQSEVNDIVKRAKLDAERSAKTKFEKSLEGKHVLSDEDMANARKQIETEVRAMLAMENKRAEYKAKGLSDAQLDAIQVDKVEDYDKRVDELFGVLLKKKEPVINPGNINTKDTPSDDDETIANAMKNVLARNKK